MNVISKPNEIGIGCSYQTDNVWLKGKLSKLGLPLFIQSYFNVSLNFNNLCYGDTTEFTLTDTVDSVVWDFGDVASGINNTSTALAPTHIFTSPGDYTVTVTATVGTETATSTAIVTIYKVPTATGPTNIDICDTDNDGFYAFYLTTQNAAILNGQDPLIFGVKYYAGLTNFNNNIEITSPSTYTNQTAIV